MLNVKVVYLSTNIRKGERPGLAENTVSSKLASIQIFDG